MRHSGRGLPLIRVRILTMTIVSLQRSRSALNPINVYSLSALDAEAVPFATQFFNDDYDDGPGFDDEDGPDVGASVAVEAGEQDLLAATKGQTRRVKPEAVNYAKRAKRVDVRKLKENIWKGLDIVAPAVEESHDAMVSYSVLYPGVNADD